MRGARAGKIGRRLSKDEGWQTAIRDMKKPGDRGKCPGLVPLRNAAQRAVLVTKARALRFRESE